MTPRLAGRDMTKGPLARNLAALAWPVMLSFLFQTVYNLVDAFWLGRLGKTALVAPTITMNVMFIALSLAMGLGAGGTTLVSQYRGAGRPDEMRRAAGQTLLLLVLVGLALAALGLVCAPQIVRLLQTPADAADQTLVYLRWILGALPLLFVFSVYQGIHLGLGDSVGPLQVSAISVAVNVALDPLLIFGWGPVPAFGVVGAALATVVARAVAAAIGLRRLVRDERGLRLRRADIRWDSRLALKILRIGLPASFGQSATALGFTLLLGVVNTFGSAVTAAFGVGNRIIHLAMVPAMGLSQANAAAVGQNLGANRPDRAQRSVVTASILIGAILLPITTLMFFFGASISRLFIDDPEVVRYGRDLFHITSYSVFVFGFVQVLLGSFQGSGHTVPVMVLNMARLWGIRIPCAYLLALTLGMGPAGLWWAMALSNTLTALAACFWFSRGQWKRRVIEDEPAAVPAGVPGR